MAEEPIPNEDILIAITPEGPKMISRDEINRGSAIISTPEKREEDFRKDRQERLKKNLDMIERGKVPADTIDQNMNIRKRTGPRPGTIKQITPKTIRHGKQKGGWT